MASESGVNLIKKKVATLKSELDDVQSRAAEAEEQLAEKEVIIEKVGVLFSIVNPELLFDTFYLFLVGLFVNDIDSETRLTKTSILKLKTFGAKKYQLIHCIITI